MSNTLFAELRDNCFRKKRNSLNLNRGSFSSDASTVTRLFLLIKVLIHEVSASLCTEIVHEF